MSQANLPAVKAVVCASAKSPDYVSVGNECYYLLSEDSYNRLVRAESAISMITRLLFEADKSAFDAEKLGDLIALPSDSLFDVVKSVNCFKYQNLDKNQ